MTGGNDGDEAIGQGKEGGQKSFETHSERQAIE
jgi:hypothetical protein